MDRPSLNFFFFFWYNKNSFEIFCMTVVSCLLLHSTIVGAGDLVSGCRGKGKSIENLVNTFSNVPLHALNLKKRQPMLFF